MLNSKVETERRNPHSDRIDTLSTIEILRVINDEDKKVAYAVEKELGNIARAVDAIHAKMASGGRLFYAGAGTSGRIGILDASECTPTFNTPPSLVQGVIAGGSGAVFTAVEGAEDDEDGCRRQLEERGFTSGDVLVGIAASGSTPFVLGGLRYAKALGAVTVALACNEGSAICEVVLNMISTSVRVKLGKVYGNLMVDMQVSNRKLAGRACRIVSFSTGCSEEDAKKVLDDSDGEVKTAIVMLKKNTSKEAARMLLAKNDGIIARALGG